MIKKLKRQKQQIKIIFQIIQKWPRLKLLVMLIIQLTIKLYKQTMLAQRHLIYKRNKLLLNQTKWQTCIIIFPYIIQVSWCYLMARIPTIMMLMPLILRIICMNMTMSMSMVAMTKILGAPWMYLNGMGLFKAITTN